MLIKCAESSASHPPTLADHRFTAYPDLTFALRLDRPAGRPTRAVNRRANEHDVGKGVGKRQARRVIWR
jgi:hypothetical protein